MQDVFIKESDVNNIRKPKRTLFDLITEQVIFHHVAHKL